MSFVNGDVPAGGRGYGVPFRLAADSNDAAGR